MEMVKLVETIAKSLVDNPDAVVVTKEPDELGYILRLKVAPEDMGKIIGKQGRNAKALRTVVKAVAARDNLKVMVEIEGD